MNKLKETKRVLSELKLHFKEKDNQLNLLEYVLNYSQFFFRIMIVVATVTIASTIPTFGSFMIGFTLLGGLVWACNGMYIFRDLKHVYLERLAKKDEQDGVWFRFVDNGVK